MEAMFSEFINPEPFLLEQQNRFKEIEDLFCDELIHFDNYGMYGELVNTGRISINTDLLSKDNIDQHFNWVYNILIDGIEQEKVHNMDVYITFIDGTQIRLTIFDYFLNLIMWKLPLSAGNKLTKDFLFFDDCITQKSIKNYIDTKFIDIHITEYDNCIMNNTIDDMIYKYAYIDNFSYYLMNTINEKDTIDLMKQNKVVYDCLHFDTDPYPLEEVKDRAMKVTDTLINIIKAPDSEHCLRDSFRAGEGVNPKQFRELAVNIGTKPNGKGGIYTININSNYLQKGVMDPSYYTIDSSSARQAQILNKENVGQSGAFSRKLRLNNMHVKIHPNPKYVCNTKTFLPIYIKDVKVLTKYKKRYFRYQPNGLEYKLSSHPEIHNLDVIGKTLYFRSPETCASHARGDGICYRCYGDLAYTNNDINPGVMASELLSSILTQRLLSAKHLLETYIKSLRWVPEFKDIFTVDGNMVIFQEDIPMKKWRLVISSEEIYQENEYDDFNYNSYINSFDVIDPNGQIINIKTEDFDNLYISMELDNIMRNKKTVDEKYYFDFTELNGAHLFMVNMVNNGLAATLEACKSTLDKQSFIKEYKNDIGLFTQGFLNSIIEGGLGVDAVHCEVLIASQIRRDTPDIAGSMLPPEWEYPNEPYQIITLDSSLKNNPSVTTSLFYNALQKTLYNPNTFKKTMPGPIDIFAMEKPQEYMNVQLDYNPSLKDDDENAFSYNCVLYHEDEKGNKIITKE